MGLSAGRGDEAHVSVVFGEKMENADEMTEGMDDDVHEEILLFERTVCENLFEEC